jgi:hypothetical protein
MPPEDISQGETMSVSEHFVDQQVGASLHHNILVFSK